MRFGELRELTSLPIRALVEQFRNEEVLTVLPVRDAASGSETLLVATRMSLAILTVLGPPRDGWMTRWAAWAVVGLREPAAQPGQDGSFHRLDVVVGDRVFHARLGGETGRRALRDFVAAFRTSRPQQAAGR